MIALEICNSRRKEYSYLTRSNQILYICYLVMLIISYLDILPRICRQVHRCSGKQCKRKVTKMLIKGFTNNSAGEKKFKIYYSLKSIL